MWSKVSLAKIKTKGGTLNESEYAGDFLFNFVKAKNIKEPTK